MRDTGEELYHCDSCNEDVEEPDIKTFEFGQGERTHQPVCPTCSEILSSFDPHNPYGPID